MCVPLCCVLMHRSTSIHHQSAETLCVLDDRLKRLASRDSCSRPQTLMTGRHTRNKLLMLSMLDVMVLQPSIERQQWTGGAPRSAAAAGPCRPSTRLLILKPVRTRTRRSGFLQQRLPQHRTVLRRGREQRLLFAGSCLNKTCVHAVQSKRCKLTYGHHIKPTSRGSTARGS